LDKFNITVKVSSTNSKSESYPDIPLDTTLKIFSWNVNGIRATINKGSLDNFVKTGNIQFNIEKPDIFCLNETKIDSNALKKDHLEKLFSDDYLSYWNCCKIKSGYSGVAIFTKFRPLEVFYGIGHDDHDEEGRVITLEFGNFYIVSVYVPNAGEGLKRLDYRTKEWDLEFINYLNKLKSKKDLILCGDLNVAHQEIDIYEPKGHHKSAGFTPEERENFTKLLDEGYIDTFRHKYPDEKKFSYFTARIKSFKTENKGWRLDYFVINKSAEERLINSEILTEYEGSDHVPIKLTWK
jgi:exodeoxyribonuclease III